MKGALIAKIKDSVTDLLYYDRKEDDSLPLGAIEKMVERGIVTVDEMVEVFRSELENGLCK